MITFRYCGHGGIGEKNASGDSFVLRVRSVKQVEKEGGPENGCE